MAFSGNPNGIESISPALTRSGYAGLNVNKFFNPERVEPNGLCWAAATPSGLISLAMTVPA